MPPTYRIGVISDTHCPEFVDQLPEGVCKAFAGVDLILHAGDINAQAVLDELRAIAPVAAVRGNHDRIAVPLKQTLECGGARIGLVHGHRGRVREFPGVALNEALAGRAFWWNGGLGHVRRQFTGEDVDAIVFGHFHRAISSWVPRSAGRPQLLFNPGATYHCTGSEARRRLSAGGPLHHRLYYISRSRWRTPPATVGLLTVRDGSITPEIIDLARFGARSTPPAPDSPRGRS